MRGLLIKDFKLMKMQKNFLLVIIAILVIVAFNMDDISITFGYMVFMVTYFVLVPMSYDEHDNGYAFLFTLPISRKGYIIEKYIFSLILQIAAIGITIPLVLIIGNIRDIDLVSDTIKIAPIIFAVIMIIMAAMLPIQIKFGAEKGRIAIIIVWWVIILIGYGVIKLSEIMQIDLMQYEEKIMNLNPILLTAIAVAIVTAITVLSIKISIAIIEKKEF